MKMKLVSIAGLAAAVSLAASAVQAQAPGRGPGQGLVITHCKDEIAKYCADVPHGAGAVPACLEKHKANLSDACKTALDSRGPHGPGRRQSQ